MLRLLLSSGHLKHCCYSWAPSCFCRCITRLLLWIHCNTHQTKSRIGECGVHPPYYSVSVQPGFKLARTVLASFERGQAHLKHWDEMAARGPCLCLGETGPGESTAAWWIYCDWRCYYTPAAVADAIQTVCIFTSWHCPVKEKEKKNVITFCFATNTVSIDFTYLFHCVWWTHTHHDAAHSYCRFKHWARLPRWKQMLQCALVWLARDYPCPRLIFLSLLCLSSKRK